MTKILYILDNSSFLLSETELELQAFVKSLETQEFDLPFYAQVERVIELESMAIVILRSLEPPVKQLTEQQQRVVHHLIRGLTVDQIALTMSLSKETVNFHITNAKNRLNLGTRNELIARCSQAIHFHNPENANGSENGIILAP
jgi:DNA-binding NarL/FixJ family response regulator